jgi:hypothetical protein
MKTRAVVAAAAVAAVAAGLLAHARFDAGGAHVLAEGQSQAVMMV